MPTDIFHRLSNTIFNARSLMVLVISVAIAMIIGRIIAALLRRLVLMIGAKADKTENLYTVNRLRRLETFIVLSIAIIRTFLILFALYFWWLYVHPSGQPTALVGASALLVIVISGALSPALRDIASGSVMMAEHWYGVGDHIKVEPFGDLQGVVERVTLRSTRIRGLNGEVIWLNNQNIQGVRIAPKGIRTIALELFVTDIKGGEKLLDATNQRLPSGPLLVVSPLTAMTTAKVGQQLWHVTAIGETAPGREWLLERFAIQLLNEIDQKNKKQVLAHEPVARFADGEAERRFARTIHNARKRPTPKRKAGRTSAALKRTLQ